VPIAHPSIVLHQTEAATPTRALAAPAPPSTDSARAPLRRPTAAAESYFGLWRDHEPHGHGMFRWFDGDMYFGEWSGGLFEGYGVYQYGPLGAYAYDRSAVPRRDAPARTAPGDCRVLGEGSRGRPSPAPLPLQV
jgi:hypothetical protein